MEMVKTACRSVVEGEGEEQRKSGVKKCILELYLEQVTLETSIGSTSTQGGK